MISQLVLQEILESQGERLMKMDTGLPRQIGHFNSFTSHALIVSGIRRCGKSTWLQQIYKGIDKPAIFLNFEDPRLAGFDLQDMNRIHEIAVKQNSTFYFFDEIQNIFQWEKFVRFRLDEGYQIFITGSNASLLSGELGTKLTGRHIRKEMFPFSYQEFIAFKNMNADNNSVLSYMKSGGFPEFIKSGNPDILMTAFNDIVIRDIAVRYNIKNTGLLLQLAEWLVSNTAKLFTANSLRKIININSSSTMSEYLSYFVYSYLFFFVPKFSYSHKSQIVNPKKIYCIDNGFVVTNAISFSDDYGRLLENMVFIQLRRQFTDIYYFSEKKECDFVVFNKGKMVALYQVCSKMDQNNMEREVDGLFEAMQFFKVESASIITLNQKEIFQKNGKTMIVLPFQEWVFKS